MNLHKKINIVIISESASFPWGMAASSRVKLMAKGLMSVGNNVRYVGLRGANTEYSNSYRNRGIIEGIHYVYPGLFTIRSNKWIIRRIDDLSGKLFSFLYVLTLKIHNNIDIILLYTRNYNLVRWWATIAKYLKIKVLLEICEWPIVKNNNNKKNANLFCRKAPLLVDGVLPISRFIHNEVYKLSVIENKIIPSFIIPILIDPEKFKINYSIKDSPVPYIVYSGSVDYTDITNLIIDAMALLKNEGYKIKLKFTGGGNKNKYNKLKLYINQMKLDDVIEFTGYLEEDSLIDIIVNASVLLAPLPDNLQTRSRFPTKLGFYLASGRPVITNPYGEINHYLKDNESALFIKEFDSLLLKEKIIFVINNNNICENIGSTGRAVALSEFEYKKVFSKFNDFILQFV
jgi:glycosyltransferase involved in cell wall biosynthesis